MRFAVCVVTSISPYSWFLLGIFTFHNLLILGYVFRYLVLRGLPTPSTPPPLVHSKNRGVLSSIWRPELGPCLLELCLSVARAETSTLLSHLKWDQEEKDDLKHRWINFSGHCSQRRREPSCPFGRLSTGWGLFTEKPSSSALMTTLRSQYYG